MFHIEHTAWSEWSKHELEDGIFGKPDKRLTGILLCAKPNDDAGRGHSKRLQVRILRLDELP